MNHQGRSPVSFEFDLPQRCILLRIDNLPPGKSWKEVRYLIGGIIHHSNILQVKMLPLMSSIVPPFVPFQSCIVTLKPSLDGDSLNELLVSLNTYQWDYYNLYAYTLPPMDVIQQFMPVPMLDGLGAGAMHGVAESSGATGGTSPPTSQNSSASNTPSTSYPRPLAPPFPSSSSSPSTSMPVPVPLPMPVPASVSNSASNSAPAAAPISGPTSGRPSPAPQTPSSAAAATHMMAPPPHAAAAATGMPSMPPHPSLLGMGPGPPRRQYYQPQFYNARSYGQQAGAGVSANGSFGGRGGHRNNRGGSSGAAPDRYLMVNAGPDFQASLADPASRGSGINGNNSRRLKQIFNEKTFRKQMTGRGMSQLQLSNFPPFLKLDSLEPIDAESYNQLKNKGMHLIETNQPEKYSRLRWTVLKDYIKLKCPRLLSLQQEKSASVQPQDGSGAVTQDSQNPARENNNTNTGNNTREFYVGVYEDHEEPMDLKITPLDSSDPSREPQYGVASATVYKAIVGFNSKELCDRCMEALRGQEYSLGYHLEVRELPPYEEEQRAV